MDGWGINPDKDGNATAMASTPNIAKLATEYPTGAISTSGLSVGLPEGQMGNSEVGHLTLGAGRIIYQELTRIGKAVKDGELKTNPMLNSLFDRLKEKGAALHLMGLLSDGGVHSHIDHLLGLIDDARQRGLEKIYIHAFLDGRDTPPSSGKSYMEELLAFIKNIGAGEVATISGRYFAMDRDNRWERVQKAYNAIVKGEGVKAEDPVAAIQDSYAKGGTDEFVPPIVMTKEGRPVGSISEGDGVLFFNFRADRAREITRAIAIDDFDGFDRGVRPKLTEFICMTEYDAKLNLPVLFKPQGLENILGDVLSRHHVRQFRVSETEKYAHVTFFFNGGKEQPYPEEERLLIPSVKDVPTYDLKPEMRAMEIAQTAVEKINEDKYSFMLMNFANGDMVGHTGVIEAAVKACEVVDKAVGMVAEAGLKHGWSLIITADHGNAEQMKDPVTGEPFTAHTTNLVPVILVDDERRSAVLGNGGGLEDIAPTILKIMGLEIPKEMTGKPLF